MITFNHPCAAPATSAPRKLRRWGLLLAVSLAASALAVWVMWPTFYRADPDQAHGRFWMGRKAVDVDAGRPVIPMQLPGPEDQWWAGNDAKEIHLRLPLRRHYLLTFCIMNSHETLPPRIEITSDEQLINRLWIRSDSGVSTFKSFFFSHRTVFIPHQRMAPDNTVVIRNVAGSWVFFEGIILRPLLPLWGIGALFLLWGLWLIPLVRAVVRAVRAVVRAVRAVVHTYRRQTREARRERALLIVIYAAFGLSGFSALVYQVAWQRMLGLFSGSDSFSNAIIVGAFLLGLGIGSLLASRFADRLTPRRGLLWFALCEIGIGVFALLSKPCFYDLFFKRMVAYAISPFLIFVFVFAGLLVPTVLMGLSLPLLARAITQDINRAPNRIGWLYGINTLGAGLGSFVAGWFLIGTYGYVATIRIAAAVNGLVALLAVGCMVKRLIPAVALRETVGAAPADGIEESRIIPWYGLMFISGFIAISLEIIWFRFLGVLLHSVSYCFSLILAVFLVGDAVGIIAGARWACRIARQRTFFINLQCMVTLYAILTMGLMYVLYQFTDIFIYLDYYTNLYPVSSIKLAVVTALTALIVFPPAVLMGLSYPVVHQAIQNDLQAVGRRVGLIQLANILGNTAGSLLTGLLLFRILGTPASLKLLGGLALLLLAGLWIHSGGVLPLPVRRRQTILAAGLVGALIVFPSLDDFWPVFQRSSHPGRCYVSEDHTGVTVLYYDPMQKQYVLTNNGRQQGYVPFSINHMMNSVWALAHPAPADVLLIGLGAGGQAYMLGMHPRVRSIDVVEIVRPVYRVLDAYLRDGGGLGVDRLLRDERYRFVVGDGRRALFTANRKYDLIQTDAVVPIESHSGLLNSIEFFTQVRESLTEGGVALEWAPTPRVLMTFADVFPYVVQAGPLLIGSKRFFQFKTEDVLKRLDDPAIQNRLRSIGQNVADIRRRVVDTELRFYDPQNRPTVTSVNTDLFPRDEFFLNE